MFTIAASPLLRGQGQRGQPPATPPPTAKAGAPIDLTGNWVSIVTEDWRFRMVTPPKGDYASVPLNAAARAVADKWDPAKDEADGNACKSYGAAAIMRVPGRLHISWQDDNTLKIETDAGQQTRLLHFTPPSAAPQTVSAIAAQPRTLQGYSAAEWVRSGGAFDAFLERGAGAPPPRWGSLKVVTTNMTAGWLRRNGVPYSQDAVVTENFTRFTNPDAGDWFVV